MFDTSKISWKEIKNPSKLFHLFEADKTKLMNVAKHLMGDFLNLSDEFRSYPIIYNLMHQYFCNPNNLIYEIGDNQAMLGFVAIYPTFKADLIFKLFDKKLWNKQLVRESKQVIEFVMKEFKLKRLNTSTPDDRIVKMSKMVGFEVEGERENNFMFDGKLFKEFLLGLNGG